VIEEEKSTKVSLLMICLKTGNVPTVALGKGRSVPWPDPQQLVLSKQQAITDCAVQNKHKLPNEL